MTQLERDFVNTLTKYQRERLIAADKRDRQQGRRLLGIILTLIFFWAVTLTALLGFLV